MSLLCRPGEGGVVFISSLPAEERAKYNAKKGGADGKLDSDQVLIETADGGLKTLGEMEAESGLAEHSSAIKSGEGEGAAVGKSAETVGKLAQKPKAVSAQEIAERDARDGTDIKGLAAMVDSVAASGAKPRGKQSHFRLAKTPDVLKGIGLTGDYFTIKTGVVLNHYGKDSDHTLTSSDWANIAASLKDPLVVSRYSRKDSDGIIHYPKNCYRIWTEAVINGKYAMVGVEVNSPGKDVTVNSVTTVYGDEHISLREKDVIYARGNGEGIRTLLGGPNPREYSESPTSGGSIPNKPMEVNAGEVPGKVLVVRQTPPHWTNVANAAAKRHTVISPIGAMP